VTLEDFSGQALVTAFPATYAKLGEYLVKDAVVRLSGAVMHRERMGNGGEKTIEVRLEDVKPLEPTLDIGVSVAESVHSHVEVAVTKATEFQLRELRSIIGKCPGEYEVVLQVLPRENYLPIYLACCVDPTPEFVAKVQACVPDAVIEVQAKDDAVSDIEEPEPVGAL
jgi:DNA polymerase III alpha subunit